jgi:hypothetical protein
MRKKLTPPHEGHAKTGAVPKDGPLTGAEASVAMVRFKDLTRGLLTVSNKQLHDELGASAKHRPKPPRKRK